jgi:CRISPR/Cas system CSM-associated protein Csm4 (group 5 of RAMP superfamily)
VAFLTVAPKTGFRLHLGARGASADADLVQLRRLVEPAMGLLGIGGKRSSGYGVLVERRARTVQLGTPAAGEPKGQAMTTSSGPPERPAPAINESEMT